MIKSSFVDEFYKGGRKNDGCLILLCFFYFYFDGCKTSIVCAIFYGFFLCLSRFLRMLDRRGFIYFVLLLDKKYDILFLLCFSNKVIFIVVINERL